ncbi:hypothetical protein [Streptomyces sp. G1]|uniref:hypothetical protein n=1 Tax=Streptomyces sp. G1 TaxID=361572 RepID=UPI00202E1C60|nr:hypothetical protein [Streptomyces sp. G1]MCM1972964.1 hypothetical protein [Streptomyces sp. G1]
MTCENIVAAYFVLEGDPVGAVEADDLQRLLKRARLWALDGEREIKVLAVLDRLDRAHLEGRWEDVGRELDALATLAPPQGAPTGSGGR